MLRWLLLARARVFVGNPCSTLSLNVASVRHFVLARPRQVALPSRDEHLTGACGVSFDPGARPAALVLAGGWLVLPEPGAPDD